MLSDCGMTSEKRKIGSLGEVGASGERKDAPESVPAS